MHPSCKKRSKNSTGQAKSRAPSSTRNREPLIEKKGRNIKNKKAGKECVPRFFIPTDEHQDR